MTVPSGGRAGRPIVVWQLNNSPSSQTKSTRRINGIIKKSFNRLASDSTSHPATILILPARELPPLASTAPSAAVQILQQPTGTVCKSNVQSQLIAVRISRKQDSSKAQSSSFQFQIIAFAIFQRALGHCMRVSTARALLCIELSFCAASFF